MKVIIDTETNALKGYDKLWCLVVRDYDTGELLRVFRNVHDDPTPAKDYLSSIEYFCGHNFIRFDSGVLTHFLGLVIQPEQVIDTLIISRLLDFNRLGGHSLEAWGERLKCPKSEWNDFSQWSQELEDRCISDTQINFLLLRYFKKHLNSPVWTNALLTEHRAEYLCEQVCQNGFQFDIEKGRKLHKEIQDRLKVLEDSFKEVFVDRIRYIREIIPSSTLKGTLNLKDFYWLLKDINCINPKDNTKSNTLSTYKDTLGGVNLSVFSAGAVFSLFDYEPFNPGSAKHRIDVLNKAGWKPVNKTKGHIKAERSRDPKERSKLDYYKTYGWKTDEENLATLPEDAPEAARKLAEWLLLSSRLGDLEEWFASVDPATRRLKGNIQGIGSWTQRKSHSGPNMANIPALKNRHGKTQPYGREMRELWCAPQGYRLVGTDADGIQLRIFAHYVNDPKLTKAIVDGKKDDGTDIHSLNNRIMHPICKGREPAKTLIYALFLGAGTKKVSEILQCTFDEATEAIRRILEFYPGWKKLKEDRLEEDGRRGYFQGLDGRYVKIPEPHKVLAGYLQNGESVIMKMANWKWYEQLILQEKLPILQVNDVHDEWQTQVLDDPDLLDYVGKTQTQSLELVGKELHMNIPITGSFKTGFNWAETH